MNLQYVKKLRKLEDCLLTGDHINANSALNSIYQFHGKTAEDAIYNVLLKVSAHTGFLCSYRDALCRHKEFSDKGELQGWVYNLCLYMTNSDNQSVLLTQYVDYYVCLVRPLRFLYSDNSFFCRHDGIKHELFLLFEISRAGKPHQNNYPLKLSMCMVECLFQEESEERAQLQWLFRFGTYAFIFLMYWKPETLWKVFEIFLKYHVQLVNDKIFMQWFSLIHNIALRESKFGSVHRSLIIGFGYCVLFAPVPQFNWLASENMRISVNAIVIENEPIAAPDAKAANIRALVLKKFDRKFPTRNVLMNFLFADNDRPVDLSEDMPIRTYYDLLKLTFMQMYESVGGNFNVRMFLEERSKLEFPLDSHSQLKPEKARELSAFEISVINPYMSIGFPNAPWGPHLELLVEDGTFVPWLYKSGKTSKCYAGAYETNEVVVLNALKHFWLITSDTIAALFDDDSDVAFLQFDFGVGSFSMHYVAFSYIPEPDYHEFLLNDEIDFTIYLYYFISAYIIGHPGFVLKDDIFVDGSGRHFFAGFFRREMIDVHHSRTAVVEQLHKALQTDVVENPLEKLRNFILDLKKNFANIKFAKLIENPHLKKWFDIESWPVILDELSSKLSAPQA